MKQRFKKSVWIILIMMAVTFGLLAAGAEAAEKVQTEGTLTFTDFAPQYNPMSWDNADWNWRHGYDTGYAIEHLIMGDLQKGPRGAKKFEFRNSGDSMPYDCLRGELVEKWDLNKQKPLSIVFHLRKGVMWQERPGVMKAREFVADDVVYSMTRLKASRKATKNYMEFVDRFEAKDKYTVVVHLNEWNSEWPYYIAYGFYDGIQAPEQEKAPGGPGKWQNVCGTGPFILEEYKNAHSVIYKKNPNYWDSDVINKQKYKLPLLDKAVSMLMKDEASRLTALRTAKLDLMLNLSRRQMEEMKKTTPELMWAKYLNVNEDHIALRMDRKPFNDIRVRRALNMAINKNEFTKTFAGGEGELVNIPYPMTAKSVFTPFNKLTPTAKEMFIYNPEKAKKLLAEAGYPNGLTFKCTYGGNNPERIDFLSMMAAQLAKAGVTMEIEVIDYPSAISRMTKKTHENAQVIANTHGTPLAFIRKSFVTGQTWNASVMSDPYVDKTWDKLVSDPSLTQKQIDAELKKLGVYLIEQAPMIFLPGDYRYIAWWPWVKNYYGELRVGSQRGSPIIARIWIDQDLKKKMGY